MAVVDSLCRWFVIGAVRLVRLAVPFRFIANKNIFPPVLPVRVQHPTTSSWEPGTVQGANDRPRSYSLVTKSGSMISQNRQQICPAEHPSPVLDTPDQSALNDSNPADSLHAEVKDCHVNTPSHGLPVSSQLEYVTRSGRLVKPVSRLDM